MKKTFYIIIAASALTTAALVSCNKKSNNVATQKAMSHAVARTTIAPGNADNPYDYVGNQHNLALDNVKGQLTAASTKQDVATYVGAYVNQNARGAIAPAMVQQIANGVVNNTLSPNLQMQAAIDDWNTLVNTITVADFAEYGDYKTCIVNWEAGVLADTQLTDLDKASLLSASSVLRWSGYYWNNEDQSTWPHNGNTGTELFKKWWQVALGDAIGGLVGSLGGPWGTVCGAACGSVLVETW